MTASAASSSSHDSSCQPPKEDSAAKDSSGGTSGDREVVPQPDHTPETTAPNPTSHPTPWQAVWSPQHNAYYFYNSETCETTWVNPLQPADATEYGADMGTPGQTSAYASPLAGLQAAAEAAGIDPSLAYLDPTLSTVPGAAPGPYASTARFNARTGAFTKADARDPTHLSEYERAKRMSEFYFDVSAWERDIEARKRAQQEQEEEGVTKKKKRPTKKDLDRFKEQKRLKKIAKTAWLRT